MIARLLWAVLAVLPVKVGRAGTVPDLMTTRQVLMKAQAGDFEPAESVGLEVLGFNFFREFSLGARSDACRNPIGPALTAIVISRNLEGRLLLFGAAGELLSSRVVAEPVSAQAYDLDDDSQAELIMEEIDGRGTGVYESRYHVYVFSSVAISEVWQDLAHWRFGTSEAGRGFVRVEYPYLLYVVRGTYDRKRLDRRRAFKLEKGHFSPVPFPD